MTFYAFRLLSPVVQFYWIMKYGTYLTQRWDDESDINLYYCKDDDRSFFVEVGIDDGKEQAVVLSSFVSSGQLENYAHGVRRPEQ